MDIEKLLQKDVQEFILEHKSVDIKELALKKLPFAEELRNDILQQIKSRQKALLKLPNWATRDEIIFPNSDLVEQSSSDITARYKSKIYPQSTYPTNLFIDLTAGLGSDALALSEVFTSGYCIEADPVHAACLEYNLKILSDKNIMITNGYAEDLIDKLPSADFIYIDPQRRIDTKKRGIYDLSQTLPNILELLPKLRDKSPCIMVKTSPFLDISEAIRQLGQVNQVHIVEADGQCKEVLYFIDAKAPKDAPLLTAAICESGQTYTAPLSQMQYNFDTFSAPLTYLYEPGPALMKSGLHQSYALKHDLKKIAPMTHLYTSAEEKKDYMGRTFKVIETLPVKKQALQSHLPDMKANITTRHFPMKPEDLRKKLGVKDGGDKTIFGGTLQNGEKALILCETI